ncbi:ImmA/IrrE family metallo-endopeptidase [Cohnella sp. GbtcB17]|uniref:ImmA/IrrE family metallo-endopeptidase n=1 Tax=Cohnella sp. GbtcB17 TaxID=2824762 RepID=UPI001C30ADD4|nr:ImmA/IrrE family metallo-endopeptidase [Cohnella sp. GbtcB17]
MQLLDDLLADAQAERVRVIKHLFKNPRLKALYMDNTITINSAITWTYTELTCIVGEELGHHYTTFGRILDQSKLLNRKQERRARQWAHERLIPLCRIVDAHLARQSGRHEIAEFLGVTEEFLQAAVDRYRDRYGISVRFNDTFIIYFDPLMVRVMRGSGFKWPLIKSEGSHGNM